MATITTVVKRGGGGGQRALFPVSLGGMNCDLVQQLELFARLEQSNIYRFALRSCSIYRRYPLQTSRVVYRGLSSHCTILNVLQVKRPFFRTLRTHERKIFRKCAALI